MSRKFRPKVEFVINPNTNRQIRVGGKSWLKLVKNGVIERGDYLPPNCAYKLRESEYEDEDERMKKLNKEKQRMIDNDEIPEGVHPVISKKNQIVYQKPKLTARESSEITSEAALDVIDKIQSGEIDLPEMNRDDARDYLQKLIFDEMLRSKKKFRNTRMEPKKSAATSNKFSASRGAQPAPVLKKTRVERQDDESPMISSRSDNIDTEKRKPRRVKIKAPPVAKRREKKEPVYYLEDELVQDDDSEYEYVYEDVSEEEIDYKAQLEERQRQELYEEE